MHCFMNSYALKSKILSEYAVFCMISSIIESHSTDNVLGFFLSW